MTAPTGCTSQWPAARPSRQICSVTPAVSATGSVLAIACTAVNPPSAAAIVPVSMVSASSRPGSRRWVCRSTSPGSAISPAASSTCAPGGMPSGADGGDRPVGEGDVGGLAAQRPRSLDDPGRAFRGHSATSSPPSSRYSTAIRTLTPLATCSTIVDLWRVGDLGRDLHPPVHRAGMHHDGVVGKLPEPGGVQPVAAAVLAHAGEVGGVHPLLLDAQHHHHVALGQRRVEVVAHRARPVVDRHGQQGRRCDERDLGARAGAAARRWTGRPGCAARRPRS